MPWWQESDTAGDDPIWGVLAGGSVAAEDRLQAAWLRIMSHAARHRTDGYLTESSTLALARGRRDVIDALCTRALADRPPLLHRPGDVCECLEDEDGWRDGYTLRVHRFLKRNPSRKENDRHKAQQADSRDSRLREAVYRRDGGCCRYCGSGPLARKGMGRAKDRRRVLQFDHVDPDAPAGTDGDNYVVACGRCNEAKGHRTPAEAEMPLRPVPTPDEAAALLARAEELHDPADNDIDNARDNRTTTTTTTHGVVGCVVDGVVGATAGKQPAPHVTSTDTREQPCPQDNDNAPGQRPRSPSGGSGLGRVGPPPAVRSGQPPRSPDSPDVYHRRSRAPELQPPPEQHPRPPQIEDPPDWPPDPDPWPWSSDVDTH